MFLLQFTHSDSFLDVEIRSKIDTEVSKLTQDSIELANAIKQKRDDLKWTQAQLAEKASVSLRTVSDYEACKGNPEMASLFPIARALHMSLDDLCFFGSAADGRDTIHDLQSIVSTCSPYEAEMLLVVSRAVLSVMRGGSTKDAVNTNKEPSLAK